MLRALQLGFYSRPKSFTERLNRIKQIDAAMPKSFYCILSSEFSNNPVMINDMTQHLYDHEIAMQLKKCPFSSEPITSIKPYVEKIKQINIYITNLETIHRCESQLSSIILDTLRNLEAYEAQISGEDFQLLKKEQSLSVSQPILEQIIDQLNLHLAFIESIFDTELLTGEARAVERTHVSGPYNKKIESYMNLLKFVEDECRIDYRINI